MADEVFRCAARAINDLNKLATVLNDAGYPGPSIRLQGYAGMLKSLESEFVQAQVKVDASIVPKREIPTNELVVMRIG